MSNTREYGHTVEQRPPRHDVTGVVEKDDSRIIAESLEAATTIGRITKHGP